MTERFVEEPEHEQWRDAAIATALGDEVLPDPEEVWLARFEDGTLLVLAVVAHAHGTSATQIRRATGQGRIAVRLSLHRLLRADLVMREHRPGPDHWFATAEGTRLGVVPYVTRLLNAIVWLPVGKRWSVGRFDAIGTEHGPPIFRPSTALADVNDPEALGEVLRTGIHGDRAYALTKLVALNDPRSVPILCDVAQARGDDELLAREATIALGHFATPTSVTALIDIAAQRDSIMREAAARSLGHLRAADAVPTLVELISYPSPQVQAAAIRALGRIGDRSAVSAITPALAESHGAVRRCARHALVQLRAVDQLKSNPSRARPLRILDAIRARGAVAHTRT